MSFLISAGSLQLEASLREPRDGLKGAVVVCHPHPVYGGTMDNRVVYRAAKAAVDAGYAALRFNFRGVGRSAGQFDQGLGEKQDVAGAVQWLADKYPAVDLALIGYSFGAWVGLQVGCGDERVKAMAGLGLPLDLYDFDFLAGNSKPSLFIVGTRDEFCSLQNLDRLAGRLPTSSSVHKLEGSDHFFSGHIESVERLVSDFFINLQRGPGS